MNMNNEKAASHDVAEVPARRNVVATTARGITASVEAKQPLARSSRRNHRLPKPPIARNPGRQHLLQHHRTVRQSSKAKSPSAAARTTAAENPAMPKVAKAQHR